MNECDVLLALSNGNAGWASAQGDIGICHLELSTAQSRAPDKVRLISLGNVPVDGTAQGQRNARFQNYLETLNLFRGGTVSTEAGVKERVKQALFEAVISLAQSGVREASRAKYYRGTALDWTRLDLASRREAMIKAAKQGLVERAGSKDSSDDTAFVTIAGKQVLFVVDAVPAPFSAINFLPFRPKRISFLIDLS